MIILRILLLRWTVLELRSFNIVFRQHVSSIARFVASLRDYTQCILRVENKVCASNSTLFRIVSESIANKINYGENVSTTGSRELPATVCAVACYRSSITVVDLRQR